MKELFVGTTYQIDENKVINNIYNKLKNYLLKYNIKSLVIGISGGLDSSLNAAILYLLSKELDIKIIGRYIHIESNSAEEKQRADKIGAVFCHDYKSIDLTDLYNTSLPLYEENGENIEETTFQKAIRRGNIKARMRMIYLYNLAQKNHGIVVDNDNMTEHLLGFWTINGDVGDITPLASLYKTEVYDLAKFILNKLENNEQKDALQLAIDAIPTDGLGITSSDVEQLGAKNYEEVDDILISYKCGFGYEDVVENYLYPTYGKECVDKVLNRHKNSNFKRHHPYKIKLNIDEIKK